VKIAPDAFEQQSDVIVGVLVKDILMESAFPEAVSGCFHASNHRFVLEQDAMATDDADETMDDAGEAMDDVDEWAADNEVSWSTQTKLLAVKICRNRCIVHGSSKAALDIGTPVLTMLLTILANDGSMSAEAKDEYVYLLR
jgi:sister-chromatid-cohesion protein PDS5